MKKEPLLLLLIIGVSVLVISCAGKQSNEAEKRIIGTWEQEGGSGAIANLNFKITYSFESENKFQMVAKAGEQIFQSLTGSYEIKADSLLLYNDGGGDKADYSARLIFNSDAKIALVDSNGELDFSKK